MEWLFKPKVQLGLFINFIFFMFTLVSSTVGDGRAYEYPRGPGYMPPSSSGSAKFVPPSPPAGPSKATSFLDKGTGDLNVYLDNDMSLIRRPNLVLLLSPLSTVRGEVETPRSVLLRFTAYADAPDFYYDDSLIITADGAQVWPAHRPDGSQVWQGWNDEPVPPSTRFIDGGSVVRTVGKEIPFAVFVKIAKAKRVRLQLGSEAADLTDEQLGALHEMCRLSLPYGEMRKHF